MKIINKSLNITCSDLVDCLKQRSTFYSIDRLGYLTYNQVLCSLSSISLWFFELIQQRFFEFGRFSYQPNFLLFYLYFVFMESYFERIGVGWLRNFVFFALTTTHTILNIYKIWNYLNLKILLISLSIADYQLIHINVALYE